MEPGKPKCARGKPTLEDYRDSAITIVFGGMLIFALVVGLVGSIGLQDERPSARRARVPPTRLMASPLEASGRRACEANGRAVGLTQPARLLSERKPHALFSCKVVSCKAAGKPNE